MFIATARRGSGRAWKSGIFELAVALPSLVSTWAGVAVKWFVQSSPATSQPVFDQYPLCL